MSSTDRDVDRALAYPEPPACSLWASSPDRSRHGPLSPAEQDCNRQLLAHSVHTRRHHNSRTGSD